MNARLEDLGWDTAWDELARESGAAGCAASNGEPQLQPGRVAAEHRDRYHLLTADGERDAALESRHQDRPAVGDWVLWQDASLRVDGLALVRGLLPRRTAFVRHVAGEDTTAQVVAANIDVLFVVTSIRANLSLRRLERYLALAWESGALPVVVVTKIDLERPDDATERALAEVALGTPVHWISSRTGEGLDAVRAHLTRGRTGALLGSSGVGKSSLVNALVGGEQLRVSDIRLDGKGRHTTTHRELVMLPSGGCLIDTPGMRALKLWNAEEGIAQTFADVTSLTESCRFRDCRHDAEPGCAVRAAVDSGQLGPDRVRSYLKLRAEEEHLVRRQSVLARRSEKQRVKTAARGYRAALERKHGGDGAR